MLALWLRYNGPDTTLSFSIMIDILLMVVIGGMGTMYGAVIGATLFVLAQSYLQLLMGTASSSLSGSAAPGRTGAPRSLASLARSRCSSSAFMHSPAASSGIYATVFSEAEQNQTPLLTVLNRGTRSAP